MKKILLVVALLGLFNCSINAQDKTVKQIIATGQTDNRTMQHENMLANVIGGRPIGSHALEDAERWVEKQFRSWGLDVIVQEVGQTKIGFSRGPWSGKMYSDDGSMTLHFATPSFTAGTKGPQRGRVFIEPNNTWEFNHIKGALKGAWVMIDGKFADAIPGASLDSLRRAYIAFNDSLGIKNAEIKRINAEKNENTPLLESKHIAAMFYKEMIEAGVLGFIQAAQTPIQAQCDRANCHNMTMETLPTVCDIKLDEPQYAQIKHKVLAKENVWMEFDIRNHFFEGPVKYHNVIGVLKGSKYPNEYVLTGGHLDSYDAATGAIDDGQGVSVTMETARLLATAGAKPKRSIMFAIWTGEENGLLGSHYFVSHNTVPLDKISNYFNRDGGPLVPTGVTVPPAMYDDFVNISKPLANLNPEFPFTVKKREGEPGPRPKSAGGTDDAHFAMNGIPTISIQLDDVKGYGFNYRDIWHTDRDLFDKAIPEYLDYSSIVNAVLVYGVANLDHLLSRDGYYSDNKK